MLPYSAARGTMGWWWTGQGSPSQVWAWGDSIGTDCTDLIEPAIFRVLLYPTGRDLVGM